METDVERLCAVEPQRFPLPEIFQSTSYIELLCFPNKLGLLDIENYPAPSADHKHFDIQDSQNISDQFEFEPDIKSGLFSEKRSAQPNKWSKGLQLSLRGREEKISDVDDIEVPYPSDFTVYDTNKDLVITLREFEDVVLSHINLNNPEHLEEVFRRADDNGDGQLDDDEFLTAPWNFADDEEVQKITDQI